MKNIELERIRRGEGLAPLTNNVDGRQEDESFYEKYWWIPSVISVVALIFSIIVLIISI